MVTVFDPRVGVLADLSNSKQMIYATVRFVDIAGLVKGASKGEGLGNQFLAHIREVDSIVHVVRCFESEAVIHVGGKVHPIEDIETIHLELTLADLQTAQNIRIKLEKQAKGNKELLPLIALLNRVIDHLTQGKSVRALMLNEDEQSLLKPYPFMTQKKMLYAANVSENDLPSMENAYVQQVREYAARENNHIVSICAKIEAEISELDQSEQADFLSSLGLEETGLNRLIRASYEMLGLIVFLTTGEKETRAWTIKRGTTAQEAAGVIHTDIQKGFIRAEVVSYEDMVQYGGRNGAREAGKLRSEGRDYKVQDGDVILFLHH